MNRLLVIAIAGFAALSLASASFANPFTTVVRGQLDTEAYGHGVDTLATGDYSSATTSVATVHDYTLINSRTNLLRSRELGRDQGFGPRRARVCFVRFRRQPDSLRARADAAAE